MKDGNFSLKFLSFLVTQPCHLRSFERFWFDVHSEASDEGLIFYNTLLPCYTLVPMQRHGFLRN